MLHFAKVTYTFLCFGGFFLCIYLFIYFQPAVELNQKLWKPCVSLVKEALFDTL